MTTFHRLAATGAALFVIAGSALAAAPANAVDATFPPTAVNDQYVAGQDNDLVVGADIGLLAGNETS